MIMQWLLHHRQHLLSEIHLHIQTERHKRPGAESTESRMTIYKCNWSQSYFTMKRLTEQKIQFKWKNVKPFPVINKCKMETDKVIWKDASFSFAMF